MKGKRILFIDRDGTLIKEVPPFYRVDSFNKLEFYPHVFEYMHKIAANLDYVLVMVTNQDGLGTADFPNDAFWPVHNFIIKSFENEGICFKDVFIDPSTRADNSPNRKPGTGMLKGYMQDASYDISNSFVIGDRITDMQLAKNLGCKGIWLKNNATLGLSEINDPALLKESTALITKDWGEVYRFLKKLGNR